MKKEIQIALATSLFLTSCGPILAKAKGDGSNEVSPKIMAAAPDLNDTAFVATIDPTIAPTTYPTPHLLDIPLSFESETPIAENCVMPFVGAQWNTGLRFMDVLEKIGNGEATHHLGVDFKGEKGTPIVSICDGTLVFAGASLQGTGANLGNIVVIKYDYKEDGVIKAAYGIYAHMENVITSTAPGTIIKKGEFIGELGNSGGWDTYHLHFGLLTQRGMEDFQEYADNNYGGDITKVLSYYPEWWNEGLIRRDFLDPRVWLTSLLPK